MEQWMGHGAFAVRYADYRACRARWASAALPPHTHVWRMAVLDPPARGRQPRHRPDGALGHAGPAAGPPGRSGGRAPHVDDATDRVL
jgi:hypothetical protein